SCGLWGTWHDAVSDGCRVRSMAALVLPAGLRGLGRDAALCSLLSRDRKSVAHVDGRLGAIGPGPRKFLGSPKLRFFGNRQPGVRGGVRRTGLDNRRCDTQRAAMVCDRELDSVDGV